MGRDVLVLPVSPQDAPVAAQLHHDQLRDSFLGCLGEPFLRVLYRRIALDRASTLLVARAGSSVLGFIAGTEDTDQLFRRFVRWDAPRAIAAAGTELLQHPHSVWETLRYNRVSSAAGVDLPSPELLSLAVHPSARRTGIGSSLIAALQEDARERGVGGLRVTVAADNLAAIATYARSGFRPATRIQVHCGRTSEVLVWR